MPDQIIDQIRRLQGGTHPVNPAGVWAVVDTDYGESITAVYETELDALRSLNGRGYGRVRFVPFGKSLVDLDIEERAKPEPHSIHEGESK